MHDFSRFSCLCSGSETLVKITDVILSAGVNACLWVSWCVHRCLWVSVYECLWVLMSLYGHFWVFMSFNGCLGVSVGLWVFVGVMGIYGSLWVSISANTLTEGPDIRIIRISEPEASDPYYPYYSGIRIIRIFELSGYPDPDLRIIRISRSGYPLIKELRIVFRPV